MGKAEESRDGLNEGSVTSLRIFGCLSFALFWAWEYTIMLNTGLFCGFDPMVNSLIRVANVLGLALGLGVMFLRQWRICRLSKNVVTFPSIAFPLLLCALTQVGLHEEVPAHLIAVSSALAGFSSAILFGPIMAGVTLCSRRAAIMTICLSSVLGALLAILINAADPTIALLCSTSLIPVSCVLFRLAHLYPPIETREDRHRSLEVVGEYCDVLSFAAVFSVVYGLICSTGFPLYTGGGSWNIILVGCCFPGLMLLAIVRATRARIDLERLQQVLCAVAILCLVLLLAGVDVLWNAGVICVVVCYTIFELAFCVLIFEIVKENESPSLTTASFCRMFDLGGMGVGWLCGLGLIAAGVDLYRAVPLVALCLLAIMEIAFALLDRHTMGRLAEEAAVEKDQSLAERRRQALASLEERYGLSPREREIFALLAEGRTPKKISEILIIAENTTKSHTYRIYRKLDIHSQQELLDAVEQEMLAQ